MIRVPLFSYRRQEKSGSIFERPIETGQIAVTQIRRMEEQKKSAPGITDSRSEKRIDRNRSYQRKRNDRRIDVFKSVRFFVPVIGRRPL